MTFVVCTSILVQDIANRSGRGITVRRSVLRSYTASGLCFSSRLCRGMWICIGLFHVIDVPGVTYVWMYRDPGNKNQRQFYICITCTHHLSRIFDFSFSREWQNPCCYTRVSTYAWSLPLLVRAYFGSILILSFRGGYRAWMLCEIFRFPLHCVKSQKNFTTHSIDNLAECSRRENTIFNRCAKKRLK